MIKLKTMNVRRKSKLKFLEEYFKHWDNHEDLISKYNIEDYNKNLKEFKKEIRSDYSIIACGKNTKLFWTQRGYSEDKSKELSTPYKKKKNPEDSPMNIYHWVKKGLTKEEAKFKIKSFRKLNKEYWMVRGYSEEESIIKVNEFQSNAANIFQKKRRDNPEKYNDINSNQVDYWIRMGLSKEESENKVSERQTTFSKEICIEKYGEKEGVKRWKDRQEKWKKSLFESDYNGKDGKSVSLKYMIGNYDKEKLINSIPFKNKKEVFDVITNCDSIEDVINFYMEKLKKENDIVFYKTIKPFILQKGFFIEYYNTTKEEIMSLIIPKLSFVKSKWGNMRWYNNHICRSDGEYSISKFLFENNINYEYEKFYNKNLFRLKTDFFLNDFNHYIEYNGMTSKSYENKRTLLENNNINNVFHSSEIEEIKEFVLKLKENK